jgi:hypothetical protein
MVSAHHMQLNKTDKPCEESKNGFTKLTDEYLPKWGLGCGSRRFGSFGYRFKGRAKTMVFGGFSEGSLPHVQVEHGSRVKASPPYDNHWPVVGLQEWLNVCSKLSSSESDDVMDSLDSATLKKIRRTTGTNKSDEQESLKTMKKVKAIISKDDLKTSTECNGTDDDGYKYGTTVYVRSRKPSSCPTLPPGYKLKIITSGDGKSVRKIVRKRTRLTKSNSDGSAAACASEAHASQSD